MGPGTARTWGGSTLDDRRDARRERLLEVGLELLGGPEGPAAVSVRSVCRHAKLTDRYFYESFADRDELLLAVYDRVAGQARRALADAVAAPGRDTVAADTVAADTAVPVAPEVAGAAGAVAAEVAAAGAAGARAAGVARAAVRAFLGVLTDDPRKGRVLLLAPMSDPALSRHALALQPAFAELIRVQLAAAAGSATRAPGPDRPPSDGPPPGIAPPGIAPPGAPPAPPPAAPAAHPLGQRLTAAALIGALTQLFLRWLDGSLRVTPEELADYCVRLLVHSVDLARQA
jgi:AcrR family transcriptional regulator